MKLFNKEKDLIFKITNLILIIWLMGAMTAFWIKLSDILLPPKVISFEDYKQISCNGYKWPLERKDEIESPIYTDSECKVYYNNEVDYIEKRKYENKKQLLIAVGNIIIVSSVIYVLNRKKDK